MPRATHSRIIRRPARRRLIPVYAAILLLVFHQLVVAYINSSFLEQFIPATAVGTMYIIGAALSVIILLFISRVLQRSGNLRLTLGLIAINFLAVLGMSMATDLTVAIPLFLLHTIIVPLLIFNLDVFLEARIGEDESTTGGSRGLLLTLSSLTGALTPMISGQLVNFDQGGFTYVYLISAFALLPVALILITNFRNFHDPQYSNVDALAAIQAFWRDLNLKSVFIANFLLQMFFVAMVVYTPLYLTRDLGFSWAEFGIIMFFAQLAYVIFEYPLGIIADRYTGEKELMMLGFLILILATTWISFITIASVIVWSAVMFASRVGAALVEVTTESYFFKKTKSSDAQIISFFRITRPLSYVIGASIGSLSLLYLPFNLIFVVFACILVPAMFYILNLEDTR